MRARRSSALAARVVAGFAIGIALAAGGPVLIGMRSFTVLSGSMEPVLSTGDVVVEEVVSPEQVRVGDIVTYDDPSQRERLITHRVRSLRIEGGRARFTTKGDANDRGERWEMDAGGRLGRVVYRVPLAGYVLARLGEPSMRITLVVIPALLLALVELRRIWRPRTAGAGASDAA